MTPVVNFTEPEGLVKAWLATTSVAGHVTRTTDGGTSIFLAMPSSAPLPAVVVTRVGGGPRVTKELPEDNARISFDCWGKTRTQVSGIAYAVMAELESLSRAGGYTVGNAHLAAAEVLVCLWQPDPESDTARYVVDALVTVITA